MRQRNYFSINDFFILYSKMNLRQYEIRCMAVYPNPFAPWSANKASGPAWQLLQRQLAAHGCRN